MNPWTALLIGLLLGWLIEYAIDWFFWRRKTAKEKDIEELKAQLQATQDKVVDLEAQLAVSQAGYSDLEVETTAKVAEVEQKAKEDIEASKPKYDSDDFRGGVTGKLAGLGIGAAAVGAAVTADDESDTAEESDVAEEDELSGEEDALAEELDDAAAAEDGELPDNASGPEETAAIVEEPEAGDPEPDEAIELDESGQVEEEPSVAGVDPDSDVPEASIDSAEADAGIESQDVDNTPAPGEPSTSDEGGQAS